MLKRYVATVLAMMLVINIIQVDVSAETVEEISTVENTTEITEAPSTEQTVSENSELETEVVDEPQEESNPQVTQTDEQKTTTNEEMGVQAYSEEAIQTVAEGVSEANAGATFAASFKQVLTDNSFSEDLVLVSSETITLTVGEGQGKILELLSKQTQTAESNYQNWNINFSSTGSITLSADYQGLGSEQFPFRGNFTGQTLTISTPTTIFNALYASSNLNGNSIEWTGTANTPILAKKLIADDEPHEVKMPLSKSASFSPYIEQLTDGTGQVTLPDLNYGNVGKYEAVLYLGDVGLACAQMSANTSLQLKSITLPTNPLNLKGTNVGSLVGIMSDNSTLTLSENITVGSATLNGTNAGGLVGSMTNATIDCVSGKTVTVTADLTATEAAGGIVGVAATTTGPLGTNANIVLKSVKANGNSNSGVLYGTCTATGYYKPLTGVSFGENAVREVSGPGNCGGLFGTLMLNGAGKCSLSENAERKLEINSSLASAANTTSYGGITGQLTGARANALVVDNCEITLTINVGTEPAKYPKYLGGIVGKQETATLDAKNSTITVNSPKTATAKDYGFGGITAYLGDKSLLIADGMIIVTDSYATNPGGGGVVGSAHKGSIVYLMTSLNLKGCQLSTNETSGQIVGSQDCSLIYAPNVAITRLDDTVDGKNVKGMELDDIGNYGELYRLTDFLTIGEGYTTSFQSLTGSESGYTLSTVQDYACLALAWQSRGYFPTLNGVTENNWSSNVKSSVITLNEDIDLTHCGIGGLTRDVYTQDDTFTGTFNGNGHTVTLDIGAENSENTITYGDGRIYRHNATGLFAALGTNANVTNLTLDGNIRLSNNKKSVTSNISTTAMRSGALTAYTTGNININNVSTTATFDAICNGGNALYLGGLVGLISGAGNTILTLGNNTEIGASFTLAHSGNGSYNHIGGAIGGIDSGASLSLTCNGTTLGGSINSSGSIYNLYAGGLIGTIWPATNNSTRTINLTSLTVNNFTLSGNVSERMGGILGAIWSDTNVTMDGLTVKNAALTANGAASLGGLTYRASGKWTVRSVGLSGLIINASNASALGLMVCHGEPYKEPVNATTLNTNVDGLYLEMAEHWDWNSESKKGYNVPSSITFGSGVFDEFVAYTAYADRSSNTPNYQITANGSGIISLKTNNETVNMGEQDDRNTYVNRTIVGKEKQANLYSRYYYNLPSVLGKCNDLENSGGEGIDTANELLIWSVYRYAASNLKSHFMIPNVTTATIGGIPGSSAEFDMTGLSYYPVDISAENITLQYANVKFYNSIIEGKESQTLSNKSTRGTDSDHTQHYLMHCALFHDFVVKTTTSSSTYTLTANGVSFTGTVGVVNGGSGALICGKVEGLNNGTNTVVCKVVLADEDEYLKAVKLNGITVDSDSDYRPVLINMFTDYSSLEVKYITSEKNSLAGSSLFGKVEKADGVNAATNISILLEGTVKLNEKSDAVFTQATLFHSLHYSDGSASYNFNKDKDYSDTTYVHDATHGKELDEGVSVEYAGLQGKYLDGDPVTVNSQTTDFSTYLPYVAKSPATDKEGHGLESNWHEIAVNVRFSNLTDGCGTYGHPYMVNANTLISVANYINNGRASNGWQLRVPLSLSNTTYHVNSNSDDVVVEYRNGKFWNGNTEYSGNVREHLQSAIYKIEENIELENFSGIGTKDTSDGAFKGVIYGNKKTITLSGGSSAFIKYSYGSVVRDLNVILQNTPSLNRTEPARPGGVTEAKRSPETFFGGVIGSVLGGDNIIENVTVSTGDTFKITPTGSKPHLIPIGGFVGVINGGGVLFRGTCESKYVGEATSYYRNPFIGRVLGGYAFYEGSGTVPDNGDTKDGQNYKINNITPPTGNEKDLNWDSDTQTLTVNNAQGLLILSAIVNSGAGSTQSVAYTNGVARNAAYNKIGKPEEEAKSDYNLAQSDRSAAASYLLKYISNCSEREDFCTQFSNTNGISILFKNTTFDMSDYGNGYRGLSARYVSNAAYTNTGVDASTVVMRIKSFDGQKAIVQNINMDVREYHDDDFHAASMGGIFNIVWTKKQSGGGGDGSKFAQNLTLQDCNISLKYVNSSGVEQKQADGNTLSAVDGLYSVSVGGFIGMANDVEAAQGSINHNYLFTNIHISGNSENEKCTIYGPNGVGGVIGTTAMASIGVTGYPGKLLADGKWALFGPNYLNCSFSNIEISGGLAAGGLVGDAYISSSNAVPGFSGLGISYGTNGFQSFTSCTVTDNNLTVGQNATIKTRAKTSIAGGLFGGAGMRVGVNDPQVNTKSGITIASVNDISKLRLSNVQISVSPDDSYETSSRPDGGENYAYAGGIIGRIGSVNPSCFYDVSINGGGVTSIKATASRIGGIQGSGYTNSEITMERCEITSYTLSGANTGGFLGNGQDPSGFKLNMSDCKLKESTVYGTSTAGGLVGDAKSFYYLHNILIKNTSITAATVNAGRLFGKMTINSAGDNFGVYAAGISVYADKEGIQIPAKDGSTDNYNGYIAYADYAGTETEVTGTGAQSPYVTVNPNYTLIGTGNETVPNKTLTGDAVGKIADDTYLSVAARIWADQKNNATGKNNLASYTKASTIVNTAGKAEPEVSTFKEVQGYSDTEWTLTDLPVLVLKGNDASAIEDYLNVITNGGYEQANVTPTNPVPVYYYDKDNKTFSLATNEEQSTNPASIYYENGQFHIRSRSFDNTLNRFSLVEVNFTVSVNGTPRTYTVSLPVVVIRELQYDYMATFSYGKEFKAGTYDSIRTHLLESTENPFTVYLTYQYNREKGDYVEYDWQTYMDDGGSMLEVGKVLHFSSGLPTGTQMILVDCQNGNQAYQYTTDRDSTTDIELSDFTSVADETTKFQSSMADVLGVTKSEKTASGKYVITDNTDGTVRLNGVYYRPYNAETDADKDRYDLTVPDLSSSAPEENYYLVITVPDQSNPDYYINGSLHSSLSWNMPSSGKKLHRYLSGHKHEVDNSSNTESTYQISTGYRQALVSNTESEKIDLSNSQNKMQIKLQDTITFSNQQVYGESDQLFLNFTANLKEHNGESAEDKQFPVGTSGTVKFYVQDPATSKYYTWDGSQWVSQTWNSAEATEKPVAASYLWGSHGGNMDLLLSADGQNALDLAGVRQAIRGSKNTGDSNIIVTAEMDVEFGTTVVLEATVPGSSENGTDIWAQFHYVGQISTQETSLSYSSMRATVDDNAGYYRNVTYQAVLSMDAANIDQLGVNPLQLVEGYQKTIDGRNASCIDLNAVLDLSNLQDIENLLSGTENITFTLSLQRRNRGTYEDVIDASKYVAFDKGWTWTISKDQYYQNGAIITNDIFDGTRFSFPIEAYVFTNQKDFANYKINLDVKFSTNQQLPQVESSDANVIYTYARIKPTFKTF